MLQTDRLSLQPVSSDDVLAFFEILSDPRTMHFMPSLPHQTLADTTRWLEQETAHPEAHCWSVKLLTTGKTIGYVNFLGGTRFPGMGYFIHPDFWGQGYASEACKAVLPYGFDELGYDRLELWIDQNNAASLRVADKLGFQLKGRMPHKYAHETRHHVKLIYGLLASEWRARQASADDKAEATSTTSFYGVEPVLMVHDVLKTAEFYRDTLGFNIDFIYGEPADHAGVSRADWTASGVSIQLTAVPLERDVTPSSYLHIRVDTSLDSLYEDYLARGVEVAAAPEDKPWGMREFAVRDVNGHVLVFATHI